MNKDEIISQTKDFVKNRLRHAEGGHDWWHTLRVYNIAKVINTEEGGNLFVVELASLLHDIADSKFHDGDESIGPDQAYEFLISVDVEEHIADSVRKIIKNISYKGGHNENAYSSIELNVVKDADRLDAIGAIGIARTFNYGGFKGRPLYDPHIVPKPGMSKEEYKQGDSPTLNHFYEKLILLKDLMKTRQGKLLAEERHTFILTYLEQFLKEFNEGMDTEPIK